MQKKDNSSVYIFAASFLLIIIAALLFIWSDYTPNGSLGVKLELASYILGGLGIVGLAFNWFRQ